MPSLLDLLQAQEGPRGRTFMGRFIQPGQRPSLSQVLSRLPTEPIEGEGLGTLGGILGAGGIGAKEAKQIIVNFRAQRGLIPAVKSGDTIKTALGGLHEDAFSALPPQLRPNAVRGFIDKNTGKFIAEDELAALERFRQFGKRF